MTKFSIDYQALSNSVDKKFYRLADVKNRIEKVAFDVVRFKDGNPDELWQIQSADDGDYIVARYSDEAKEEKKATSNWNVLVSKGSNEINVFYKGHPINKFASNNFGMSQEDLSFVSKFLPEKLANDRGFVKALLETLDNDTKQQILKLYPELS